MFSATHTPCRTTKRKNRGCCGPLHAKAVSMSLLPFDGMIDVCACDLAYAESVCSAWLMWCDMPSCMLCLARGEGDYSLLMCLGSVSVMVGLPRAYYLVYSSEREVFTPLPSPP